MNQICLHCLWLYFSLEAAFQVPMPGDSGSSHDAGNISNYCLTQEIFTQTTIALLSFNKSETVLCTIAKILLILLSNIELRASQKSWTYKKTGSKSFAAFTKLKNTNLNICMYVLSTS